VLASQGEGEERRDRRGVRYAVTARRACDQPELDVSSKRETAAAFPELIEAALSAPRGVARVVAARRVTRRTALA